MPKTTLSLLNLLIMNTTTSNSAAMNNLWNYIQGLSLSSSDQKWLGARLIAASESVPSKSIDKLVFPKIGKDFKPSAEILSHSLGPLPEGFDIDKELDTMWEELAK